MGKIKKILENELVGGTQSTDVYPVTSVKAVYDENNERLDHILARRGTVNVSTNYNSDHIAEVLTLAQAIAKVPSSDKVLGFRMTFLSPDGWVEYQYSGDSIANWDNIDYWSNYINSTMVSQEIGNSKNKVMSQGALQSSLGLIYPIFSTSQNYEVGSIVSYNGHLYEFTGDYIGEWDGSKVKPFTPNSKYSKVPYHSLYKSQNNTTIRVDRAIKELWLSPDIPISNRNNIILGNVAKKETTQSGSDIWRVVLYDAAPGNKAIEYFTSERKENSLEILKGQFHGSYILIDWREVPVGTIVGSIDPIYKIDADYVFNINNFPILKEHIKTENYSEISSYAKKVCRHSIFDINVDKEHKDLIDKAIKELYLEGIDDIATISIGSFVRKIRGTTINRLLLFDASQTEVIPLFNFETKSEDGVCILKSGKGIGYALIDWSVLENQIEYAGGEVKSGYNLDKSYVTNLNNFQTLSNRVNEDLTYNKVYYHPLFAKNAALSNRINKIVKELYIAPDSRGIKFVSDLCLSNIQKGTRNSSNEWRIQVFDSTKEAITPIEIFISVANNNGLNVIKSSTSNSYIVVDWSEVNDGENVVAIVDKQYNLNADYVTNLNNFPIIKQYLYNKEHDDICKGLQTGVDKIYYHSLTINDTNNTKLLNKIIKEVYLSDDVAAVGTVSIGNIRKAWSHSTAEKPENLWQIITYNTSVEGIESPVAFFSVNKKSALELIKGNDNKSYILIDWSEVEDGTELFRTTSSELDLDIDYVSDINNFPIIKQHVELQNINPQVSITKLFEEHFNTPAISWVDDDFNLTSVPKIKAICDEVGCKCDFALIPNSTGGTTLDYNATYSIPEKTLTLAKEYELEGFHIEMHPPHYGWYNSPTMGGEYSGRKWVENNLVKTIRAFKENNLLNSSCIIYPGSSGVNQDVINMASCHVEFGVNAGGSSNYNDGVHNKFSLNRLFISFTSSHTKTWYKSVIDEAVSKGAWLILGTHGHEFNDSGTVDETSKSLANLKEVIQYANEKCTISPISQVFKKRKPMLDLYPSI